jgi:hypothetical protein
MKLNFAFALVFMFSAFAHAEGGETLQCSGVLTTVQGSSTEATTVHFVIATTQENPETATLVIAGEILIAKITQGADGKSGLLQSRKTDANFDLAAETIAATSEASKTRYQKISIQMFNNDMSPSGSPATGMIACDPL